MKILVNGKKAVLKAGSSFEYVSENPLFTEAEDYSLEIEFPLKNCPQNILIFGALHVKGVDIGTVSFPCEIITESFDKTGILTITSVSNTEVKGQFLEGMSSENFTASLSNIYIDELDYSAYDGTDGTSTSIDRALGNGFDWLVVYDKDREVLICDEPFNPSTGTKYTSARHIYLSHLVELVAQVMGWSVDDSTLRSVTMYTKIIVANSTYLTRTSSRMESGSTKYHTFMQLNASLPHWTAKDFFYQVGLFFGCIAVVDSVRKVVRFESYSNLMSASRESGIVDLNILDDFEVEINDNDPQYRGNKGLKLPDDCDENKLNRCPWFNESLTELYDQKITYTFWEQFSTLRNIFINLAMASGQEYFWPKEQGENYMNDLFVVDGKLMVMTERESRKDKDISGNTSEFNQRWGYLHFHKFTYLNQFGDFLDGEEVKLAPCPIEIMRIPLRNKINSSAVLEGDNTLTYTQPYKVPVLNIPVGNGNGSKKASLVEVIKDGEHESDPYDILWLVLHSGTMDANGYHINTRKLEPYAGTEYTQETITKTGGKVPTYHVPAANPGQLYSYNLSPADSQIQSNSELPSVDETKLYRYKFLSKTLPDPKAIYAIKGKRYACLRLTAHFTVDGMSELIEGEFYEIVG